LRSWIETLKSEAGSKYDFYVGKGVEGVFGGKEAVRFTVIVPSEYIRDSQSDWDRFEVILTYNEAPETSKIWLTTKNYMHRSKGLISTTSPLPDWEYSGADNTDASNARLEQIAIVLKSVAEGKHQKGPITTG
jgi:hypothetical protein